MRGGCVCTNEGRMLVRMGLLVVARVRGCGDCVTVVRKEAWLFCRTSSGVRQSWELEQPKGPKGPCVQGLLEIKVRHNPYM
jgi:hypothetical protein